LRSLGRCRYRPRGSWLRLGAARGLSRCRAGHAARGFGFPVWWELRTPDGRTGEHDVGPAIALPPFRRIVGGDGLLGSKAYGFNVIHLPNQTRSRVLVLRRAPIRRRLGMRLRCLPEGRGAAAHGQEALDYVSAGAAH
jgi:hypothetical protein